MTRDNDESTEAFMARLAADPVRARVRAEFERAAQKRIAEERCAAEPIRKDLEAAGHPVNSVWDLVNTSTPYPKALPVLMEHLEKGDYPARVLEAVARALAVKPAIAYWDRLVACYRSTPAMEAREGIAVALAASVTPDRIGDLMTLTEERQNGDDSPLFFLKPIVRLGGAAGRDFVDALTEDPALGKEATALMKRARKNAKN